MLSSSAPKSIQSNISICFGQNILQQKTSIDISLTFEILSQKNENVRFNLQDMLNQAIAEDTLVIQLTAKNGYGSELRNKIVQFIKTNPNYLRLNAKGRLIIKCIDKSQKCYIFIQSNEFAEPFQKISQICSNITIQKKQNIKQNNLINLTIKSRNTCEQIRKLLDNQGGMRAAFDSLCLNLNFNKSVLVQKVIQSFANEIQIPQIIGPLKSFKNLNLNINFASSQQFDKYQKIRVFAKIFQKIQTNLFSVLKGQYKDQIKINYFNKVFSFSGRIYGQNIENLIDGLFGQQQKEQ